MIKNKITAIAAPYPMRKPNSDRLSSNIKNESTRVDPNGPPFVITAIKSNDRKAPIIVTTKAIKVAGRN